MGLFGPDREALGLPPPRKTRLKAVGRPGLLTVVVRPKVTLFQMAALIVLVVGAGREKTIGQVTALINQ